MYDVPILRRGRPYLSKETLDLCDYATGEPVARLSLANPGLISRDLREDDWTPLQDLRVADILDMLGKAAGHFMSASLPVGDRQQSPEEFVATQSATTGLPHALCRQNMAKIESAMRNMGEILDGLSGGLALDVIDRGYGHRDGHVVSYAPKARRFGAVLPANSPGVHALWLPAFALKMPLALKPGQREPWTPLRILAALRAAGFPDSGFGFYPSGHDGAGVILRKCGASMMFGAGPSVRSWQGYTRIEIHGPGLQARKSSFGPDKVSIAGATISIWSSRRSRPTAADRASTRRAFACLRAGENWPPHWPNDWPPSARNPAEDATALLSAFADPATARGIDARGDRAREKLTPGRLGRT